MRSTALLTVDAIINLALGALLAVFPSGLVSALGIPDADVAFYPSILGAVLFGIGVALLIERRGSAGLGLAGAISINLSGGFVLAAWLASGSLSLPVRAQLLLWGLVVVLFGISGLELAAQARARAERSS